LNQLEQKHSGGSCDGQHALFTPERQRETRPEVEFSKTCLKHSLLKMKALE
jgi:hypothetical protein